jgi:hypothetical protein
MKMSGKIDPGLIERLPGGAKTPSQPATGNKVREQLNLARHVIRNVARGRSLMQMIGSEPGLGKTHITLQELKAMGIQVEWVAPDNVAAFVQGLYDHRDKKVIVLNDCDVLARSERVAGIAKMAWDELTRTVSRGTMKAWNNAREKEREEAGDEKAKYDPLIPPSRFKVRCGLIWLTNINFNDPANVEKHMAPHFRALCSRGLDPMWIDTSDTEDLFRYCIWLGTEGNMLRNLQMRKPVVEAAIGWFIENRNRLQELSPRTLRRCAETMMQDYTEAELELALRPFLVAEPVRSLPDVHIPKIIGGGKWG